MSKFQYKMIIDDIINKINKGILSSGDKLPSQRKISEHYNVNRSTVIQAIDILKSYGILESIEKKGVYVSQYKWNAYITSNIHWQSYIGNSISKNNQYYIQRINELEFKPNMIRLGTGELSPKLIPNHLFKEIISNSVDESIQTNYEEPKGKLGLRLAIVNYMKKRGVICDVDNICITSGAVQGLKLIADGLLIPESKIIIETPSYINSVRTWHNIRSQMIPLSINYIKKNINNIFKISSDYKNSIFYCIPTLHNPTQNTYTKEEKQKIIDQCQKNGIPIVEDSIYSDLWFNAEKQVPMKSLKNSDNVLYLGSLSKTVSPGLRIGWIVADKNVIRHLSDLKMQNDYGASSISQHIATKWLNTYHDRHIDKLKVELEARKHIFIKALKEHLSMYGSWSNPSGSFYIWFKFSISINVKTLFIEAIKENILIQPGEIYDLNHKNYIRFSYSYIDKSDIDISLKKLSNIINRISI
ncbi:PLP-dependent aminotransferase family protein [Staphylococcus epidermidis]|uniref:aminotransferase-like domain-containing protein n=2 Tax=Staphylococcus epidermidis TaxID=1282 RepID=UPI0029035562|nr:aminotransferase class I/II-fold pyridoxal phosphate-dependent enzyme [Staphylococcus epidermidis]MCG1086666.1 PLP-dependent aminotransferase family protein [Staphylococcus epidermidis]MCG2151416.1 PLP-dependent aminotransferase family protein [Staphylococcus epidermidis]MDU0427405.1 PLP-dependent aminotransferase family protein [Staphylococcus epidermidis]MDU0433560.1 PLP-dependent aminotransferase family protein [Staphylococcus epidermidis]MDU0446275.1 PLP-dependent aminotransferase famil